MGNCINGCVRAATYAHDKYIDARWDSDAAYGDIHYSTSQEPGSSGAGGTGGGRITSRTIHVAVVDKNIAEIRRLMNISEPDGTYWLEVAFSNTDGETALHLAARLGYLDIAHALLDGGYPADICTIVGTPLHALMRASQAGYLSDYVESEVLMERMVCRHGCNVDGCDRFGCTALYYAAETNNVAMLTNLLRLDADPNIVNSSGFSPLYITSFRGHLECVKTLLALGKGKVLIDSYDSVGRTVLVSSLIVILNSVKDNAMCSSDQSYIIQGYQRMAIVEAILVAGADTRMSDHRGRTALSIAFDIIETDWLQNLTLSVMRKEVMARKIAEETTTEQPPTYCPHTQESMYTPLVRMLVLKGVHLPVEGRKQIDIKQDTPQWLQQLYAEAYIDNGIESDLLCGDNGMSSLLQLCRVMLRSHLAMINKLHELNRLPLPPKLLNYVALKYL